jgi:Xaa-Pro dipeptidase
MLELRLLQSSLPYSTFDDADALFAELRMYKDEIEFNFLQEAVDMAQDAMRLLLQEIKVGMTEKEIASMLVQNSFKLGSEAELPFSPIVASGPNSANPHATPTDRKIQHGDLLLIDWGVNVNGYFSDLTRTFSIGDPSPQQTEIYNIVHEANQAAHAAVKPGIIAGEVDKAARDVIEQAGYGEYFITRTGHGLGMQVHEPPYIRPDNEIILKPGMVFTIEPGIYLPDQEGVRIEDDVIVTEDGIHSFSDMSREMKIIGK